MTVSDVLSSVQYVVDEDGNRTAAVIQISAWQRLLGYLTAAGPAKSAEANYGKSPEQIVARVQSRPADPDSIISPQGSLLDALQNPTYEDNDFDLDEWTQRWSEIEHEMKATTHRNDAAEGRI